ncbi:protein of unknown function (plasmid) [Caballeronia sp. S22]
MLQHTDCGIKGAPVARRSCVADDKLDDLAITDPYKAVATTWRHSKPTRICRTGSR